MHMLNTCVCGTFQDEYDELCLASPGSSPKKSKTRDSNNPYSTRGLDKFSALLADLDEKRKKIYSQMNPHDISFVRFVSSNTDDFVPIVVKVKNRDQKHKSEELRVVKARNLTLTSKSLDMSATESTATVEERKQPKLESDHKKVTKKSLTWNMTEWDMVKPSFYLPLVMILILMFLTVFGRSVAILCICILWYVIPTLRDGSSNQRKSMKKKDYARGLSEKKVVTNEGVKKKDYVRGLSEKKMVVTEGVVKKKEYVRGWSEKKMATDGLLSPRSGNSEASKNNSPGKHGHKKSW
ncbi:uncharacterized protein LOC133302284 [Gastrolobium bilobum]|uniref:uncharacterized protein LOC133302284 n=1 Tax=Gastrolobium bilobum TaxID=150636 RepID=UPI002AB1818A|nr:uncharacterized protein LOC133302284 [Gastrolobium bilobum]